MKDNTSWFVSDLHLFSRRSSAPQFEAAIRAAVQRSHTFILGGDIFDFRWSTQLSRGQAMQDGIAWLRRLIGLNTDCRFHYLLGNHDCHPEFVQSLERLVETTPQLVWHRHKLRIGDSIFLHGDIVDTKVHPGQSHHSVLDSRRLAGELRPPPAKISHALYDVAVQAKVHRLVVHVAKRRELVLRRLATYLKAHDACPATGVQHVYFGHTHRRLISVPYAGMRFHNPGAAIKGLPFQMIETTASPGQQMDL
ncbi:MAG: metallophosphoesterase [Pirellulaceae bacterium]|nr:metallophosphoesterase [Pirellulaceae bacterium]